MLSIGVQNFSIFAHSEFLQIFYFAFLFCHFAFFGCPCSSVHRISKFTRKFKLFTAHDRELNVLFVNVFSFRKRLQQNAFLSKNITGTLLFILSIVRDSRTKSCYPYRVARSDSEASARNQLESDC